jgi:putative DNA primase/helicase
MLTEALKCAGVGWRVLPVKGKVPLVKNWPTLATTEEDTIRQWWTQFPAANIGLATGKESDLFVLDVDPAKGGDESLRTLEAQHGALPQTIEVLTGGGGRHCYFTHSNLPIGNSASALGPGLDIRTDGGQVVAPPSLHPVTGRAYEWDAAHHPADVPLAAVPAWLLAHLTAATAPGALFVAPEKICDGARNTTLYKTGRSLKAKGLSREAMAAALRAENTTKCAPPLASGELDDLIDHAWAQADRPEFAAISPAPVTDARPDDRPDTIGDPGLTKTLADEIQRTDYFARDIGGHLYAFVGGTYRPTGEERITQRVKAILVEHGDSKRWSSHRAREVLEFIRVDAPRLWDRPPKTVLNLANGLLDLDTHTLRLHSADHLTAVQLPVTYDPTATCPLWDSFIARVLPNDGHTLPYELVAASMRGEVSDQQAALLVGPGENGKSTLLEAIVAFLGRENVACLALQRLELDKFSVVRLLDKLANICADLPSEHLTGTSTFKALTGGDRLTAERKFQGSFDFTPFARLIFSANHYPQSRDNSQAFFRRWLVVPFEAVIAPHERISNLASRLADQRELSGALNRVLAVLPHMSQRGGFSQSETTQAALMEFREMTDPLAAWLDRCTVMNPEGQVTRKDLTIVYNAASEAAGRPPMTSKAFCAAVRRLRPTIQDKQRKVGGEMKDVFLGLTLRVPSTTPTAPDGLFPEEVVHDDH